MLRQALEALRLRHLRRRLLWRAFRARHQLTALADRTGQILKGDILGFATVRNEAQRLPYFLDHHRRLGVRHFLIIDNASDDGSADWLQQQADVSVWTTGASYKASRFGLDWINWLLFRHGTGHWCLTLDADELLVFPDHDKSSLRDLTDWLDTHGVDFMAALMLDLYPKGRLAEATYLAGQDPVRTLPFFDPTGYDRTNVARYAHVSIRGGPRRRVFFANQPELAPHLHKVPLIRWHWRYAYLSSTHLALPIRLNAGFTRPDMPTGALLHTKLLPSILQKSQEERHRAEHFTHPDRYGDYYDGLTANPEMWNMSSMLYQGVGQLEGLGLVQRGQWAKMPESHHQ